MRLFQGFQHLRNQKQAESTARFFRFLCALEEIRPSFSADIRIIIDNELIGVISVRPLMECST